MLKAILLRSVVAGLLILLSVWTATQASAYSLTRINFDIQGEGGDEGMGYIQFGAVDFNKWYTWSELPGDVSFLFVVTEPAIINSTKSYYTQWYDSDTMSPGSYGFYGDVRIRNEGPYYYADFSPSSGTQKNIWLNGSDGAGNVHNAYFYSNTSLSSADGRIYDYITNPGVYGTMDIRLNFTNSVWLDDPHPESVPEPATSLLLGTALAGAAAFRKKYKRKGN